MNSASRARADTLASVSDAPLAVDRDAATAAQPLPSRGVGAIALFAAIWAALVVPYAALVVWIAGPDAIRGVDPPFGIAPPFRFNAIYGAVIAFLATALWVEHRAIPCDLAALRGVVAASNAQWERWRVRLFEPGRARIAVWAACGALVGQVVNLLGRIFGQQLPDAWPGHYAFMDGFASLLFALMVVMAAFSLRRARVFLEMGRRVPVRLLETSELRPFARAGLRGAAYWFFGSSIASLLMLDAGAWGLVASVMVFTLGLGVVAMVVPSRGVHESLRDAKAEELARVRGEIERARAALQGDRSAEIEAARMPALLAWEARVEQVGVWPFDAPTLVRFALFLLVPIGSWLGGALVERAVDAALR